MPFPCLIRASQAAFVLEEQLNEASKLNARLQEELKDKSSTILQLTSEPSAADIGSQQTIAELQAKLDEYSGFLSSAKTAIENVSSSNTKLSEERGSCSFPIFLRKADSLSGAVDSLQSTIGSLNLKITDLESEVQATAALKETVRFLKQKNEELANRPKENIVFGPNHPLSQLETPLKAIFDEQPAADAGPLLQRAVSIATELEKAFVSVKSPSVGLLGQTLLDLIRMASNPTRKLAAGGQSSAAHGNEATALLVVSMLALQKLRESIAQVRKKGEEFSELSEDYQQSKAQLLREQQARPKLQHQLTSLSTENEEMKLRIARLEKDLEGRAPEESGSAVAEIRRLELECDRLRLQIIESSNKNLKQITECNEDIMKSRKRSQQLEHQLLRTEMMLAEKNAFLAEQQALIDQFNFFN